MAAARAWEEVPDRPPAEIARALGQQVELLLAIPEHKVDLPGGGRPTQCDIFALVRVDEQTCTLAVEAKVNEAFGPTVGEWMVGASSRKAERMRSICALLGLRAPAHSLRYQLFHRTAAAVIEAQRFKTERAAMVVQSFSQEHRWFDDFAAFAALFGVEAERGRPLTCILPSGLPLTLGWATGSSRFAKLETPCPPPALNA
ncbi:MAG: hypothetical protein U1E40_09705 [Amaricoccus sp.]